MTFEREERIAFARIISDLIEADFIVEEDEMASLDEIVKRDDAHEKKEKDSDFRITMSMLSEAKTKTFAEAVSTLQGIRDESGRKIMIDRLCKTSLSDGTCVPLEALQIMAVRYALEGKGQVFSIPSGSSYIENMKVLYIENEDNTATDAYIRSHYRAISNEFRLAGFDFVYIPQIVEDYKAIRGDYLQKVITYMMPLVSDAKVEQIQRELCSMTTSRFSHELLYKKMGINMLNSKPAFLIKIGESAVADKCGVDDMERSVYSNFLLMPVDNITGSSEGKADSVLGRVAVLMDTYRSMVSENLIVETRPIAKKFLYYGFHRALFDLIAYGKDKTDYKLVINLKNRKNPVVLRPVDERPEPAVENNRDLPIDLNAQPYTLYILMVYLSLFGNGLDWKDYPMRSDVRKKILDKYNAIYGAIGKGNTNSDYRDKTHVSRIKKSLRSYEKVVSNIDRFVPEKIASGSDFLYRVPVSPDFVYVIEGSKGKEKEVRMVDSQYWTTQLGK